MSGREQNLGSRGAVPKGHLVSLFYVHCKKEIMNIIGICAYISRKADYCSSLLGALSELCQEVVGHMMPRKDIKRMVLILWSREGGAQGLVYQRMGAEVQHLRLQVFESRDGPDRGERREL